MMRSTLPLLVLAVLVPAVLRADQDIVPVGKHVGNLTLAVDTTYADPNTMENVHVTGSLLVQTVIKYAPNNPIKVLTRYKVGRDIAAVGMTSGDPYKVKGRSTLKYSWVPANPIKALDHTGVLVSVPTSPILPGTPIRVHYHVDYDPGTGAVSGSLVDYPVNPILNTCTPIAQVCN